LYRTLVFLLLILWGTRITSLEALPLHNDEGLHLTRAIEVWNLHPFWEIRDGKIINHWLIAAFYPQNEPVFVGRIATVLVSLVGLAAGYALVYRCFGYSAALLAGIFWICSPYLFFYERLAFSDAEAGALVVLALWASLRLARTGKVRDALFTGLALALAALFKFTAVPFAASITLIVLVLGRDPLRRRLGLLVIVGLVVAVCFTVPVAYLLLRGDNLFDIALGWIGVGSNPTSTVADNLQRNAALFYDLTIHFADLALLLGIAGVVLLVVQQKRTGLALAIAVALPLLSMLLLAREAMPRHFVVALPAFLVIGGARLGANLNANRPRRNGFLSVLGGVPALVFTLAAVLTYQEPARALLPAEVRAEHVTDHSAGYGLREAVRDFPNTIEPTDAPILASMFPDSCRRANFYAVNGLTMICAAAPGVTEMEALLRGHDALYVLTDMSPLIGADMRSAAEQLGVTATQIAAYPRPGETAATASVVLWRVER
jgi:hypothetical protein